MNECRIRLASPADAPGAYHVCLKTGDHGGDGEPFHTDDPDALGRIFIGPYLAFEPGLSLVLEDATGICGYALGLRSRAFYDRTMPNGARLCARFPDPQGNPSAGRVQHVHHAYHHPDYFCPEPTNLSLAPAHRFAAARSGPGYGRRMLAKSWILFERAALRARISVSARQHTRAGLYHRLAFHELIRVAPLAR